MKNSKKQWTQLGLCTLILSLTACNASDAEAPAAQANEPEQSVQLESRNEEVSTLKDITTGEKISNAVADLAKRTGLTEDAITIHSANAVNWGSGAIGCPKPGMNYTQALVPGMRLLLEANGTIHYYHGENGKALFYCPADRARAPAYGQGLEVM